MPREANRFDGLLGGNNFRIKRDADDPYRRRLVRSILPFNQSEEHQGKFNTRQDIRTMHQTSWADGAQWNIPLISAASIDSYAVSEGMDVTSVPGDLAPYPDTAINESQKANLYHALASVSIGDDIYVVGVAATTNATVRNLSVTAGTWSTFTNEFPITAARPVSMIWDQENDRLVALFPDGNVDYVDRDDSGSGSIIDVGTLYEGANLFIHFGRMMVYTGEKLVEITDPYGSPAVTTIHDDGTGPDFLEQASTSAAQNDRLLQDTRLAIATAEGVYYVKNVEQEGSPSAFIYRIDRTNSGIDIGTPVATLPPGVIALDIGWHLGSLLISTASDVGLVMDNDCSSSEYPRIDIYHYTNQSLGSVGSPLGGVDPDEAPYRFCGSSGDVMYLGGQKRAWVYDGVRGGLHPIFTHLVSGETGAVLGRAFDATLSGDQRVVFFDSEGNYKSVIKRDSSQQIGPGETRWLESNYFDFNIPAEKKSVTHVTLMTDGMNANETWTVALATDDGAFTDVATFTNSDSNTTKKRFSTPAYGHRFRYKITHSASSAADVSSVKGIVFHALQGEMVSQWRIVIDGKEFRNVEGQPIRPETVLTWIESIAGSAEVTAYVDEMRETAQTYNVKVDAADVIRQNANEIDAIQVSLTEDT